MTRDTGKDIPPLKPHRELASLPIQLDSAEWLCGGCGGTGMITGVDGSADRLEIFCTGCKKYDYVSIHDLPNGVDYFAAVILPLL